MDHHDLPHLPADLDDLRWSDNPWTWRLLGWAVLIVTTAGIGVMLAWRG